VLLNLATKDRTAKEAILDQIASTPNMTTYKMPQKDSERTKMLRKILLQPLTFSALRKVESSKNARPKATFESDSSDGPSSPGNQRNSESMSPKYFIEELGKELDKVVSDEKEIIRLNRRCQFLAEVGVTRRAPKRTTDLTKEMLFWSCYLPVESEVGRPWSTNKNIHMVFKDDVSTPRRRDRINDILERRASARFLDRAVEFTELHNLMDLINKSKTAEDLEINFKLTDPFHPVIAHLHDHLFDNEGALFQLLHGHDFARYTDAAHERWEKIKDLRQGRLEKMHTTTTSMTNSSSSSPSRIKKKIEQLMVVNQFIRR